MRPHRAKMSDDMLEMLMHLEMQWQLKAIQTSLLMYLHQVIIHLCGARVSL